MKSEKWIAQKQFDISSAVEDVITTLCMLGLTHQGALKLLILQASNRLEDNAVLRELLTSILNGLYKEDDCDDEDA